MIGRKKGGGSFVFFVEKEKPKIKKKIKNLSFFGLHFLFCHAGNKREKKKKQFLLSQTAFPPVRPSVVEKDLEDVHHRGDV